MKDTSFCMILMEFRKREDQRFSAAPSIPDALICQAQSYSFREKASQLFEKILYSKVRLIYPDKHHTRKYNPTIESIGRFASRLMMPWKVFKENLVQSFKMGLGLIERR